METKTNTVHSITTGRIEISGSRIIATCLSSGDSVTLELPYSAISDAVETYLTDRLMRWDRDKILSKLMDVNRQEDAKAEAKS